LQVSHHRLSNGLVSSAVDSTPQIDVLPRGCNQKKIAQNILLICRDIHNLRNAQGFAGGGCSAIL
jgi:hypothetical protein